MRVSAKNPLSPGTFWMLDLTSSGFNPHGVAKFPFALQAGAGTAATLMV
jgi:hypothetical protein